MIKFTFSKSENTRMNITILPILLFSLLIHVNSIASEKVTFDAHVHGLSEMTVAIDTHALEIEIKSPAINLVGFEHTAETKEDITIVKAAELLLNKHNALFSFSGGHCEFLNKSIDVSSIINTDVDIDNHTEKEHDHDHEHEHEQAQPTNINHSEVIANYAYRCEKTSDLSAITVTVFDVFPDLKKMKTMWISETQQGAVTLNTTHRVLHLK